MATVRDCIVTAAGSEFDAPDLLRLIDRRALEVPFEDELRHSDKDGAAQLLDGALRRLMRARGGLERRIGRRLCRLKQRDGFIKLGYARLSDYLCERSGMGLRSAQEAMRLASRLDDLPLLRAACDTGSVAPSHLKELVRVATPESEASWMARATGMSVRALRVAIREHLDAASKTRDDGGGKDGDGEADDEPRSRISFAAPASFVARWAAAVDLFRKLEGRDDLSEAAAAEAFAAEWRSGVQVGSTFETAEPEPESERGFDATERERRERAELEAGLDEWTEGWSFFDDNDSELRLPEWLVAPDGELSDDPFVLDRELERLGRIRRKLDALCGRMLLTMGRLGLFRAMCFLSIGHYARERLGLSARKASELKRIERKLFDLPEVCEAVYRGELGMSRVRQLVAIAGDRNERVWLERARQVTVRRLEQEVRYAKLRAQAIQEGSLEPTAEERDFTSWTPPPPPLGSAIERPEPGDLLEPGERHTSAHAGTVSFAVDPEINAFWQECVDLCQAREGPRLSEWECAARFIAAFVAVWDQADPRRAVLAHKIFERDGWRCSVPGCRARGGLHAHHIKWRSQGGDDDMSNLTTTCSVHHLHGIHEGALRVTGTAPHELVWELGVAGGKALARVGPGEVLHNCG